MVSEFLAEEKKMLAWMEGEKRKYLNAPERHQDYTSEWNYFYEKKCQEERVKVHPSMIRSELRTLEYYRVRHGKLFLTAILHRGLRNNFF